MVKKAAGRLDERDQTLEVAALPVTESATDESPVIEVEIEALPVIEAELEAPSDEGDKDRQAVKLLELKIAELEDKFVKLQTELNTLINKKKKKEEKKQKKKKKEKESKENKVKCKCKDKKVDIVKCKCKSKEIDE